MNHRPVGSAPPPFYWKVPVPEKDYMSENYRRIRQIANQAQKKRSEPLKAAFIPGVTRNEKYAHVTSRVGEFLKTKRESTAMDPPRTSFQQHQKQPPPSRSRSGSMGGQNQQPVNRRLSKSSTDLRTNVAAAKSSSAINLRNPHPMQPQLKNNHNNSDFERRRRRVSESSSHPQESVYNWHFKDDVTSDVPLDGASLSNGFNNSYALPAKYCHRVEYLPCDGICAEENFVVDETQQPESARSGSSVRTSRGCNTEETRILEDPTKSFEVGSSLPPSVCQLPKSRSVFTLQSKGESDVGREIGVSAGGGDGEWFQPNHLRTSKDNELSSGLGSMRISGGTNTAQQENGRIIRASTSTTSLKQMNGRGETSHTPGTVPKYLKQRQEEWKIQEKEKKEAEMTANVPQGYVLLSEKERLEHLKTFKTNYDTLINELNRIPIRIDTIRVREHKIQLEQQLTRLEEAMKTFSRPRVWIKVDR